MSTDEKLDRVLTELTDVKRELADVKLRLPVAQKREPMPPTLLLKDFCKRCNRSVFWGYEMIKRRKIIPCKTGKPYEVPVEQLQNFLGRAAK